MILVTPYGLDSRSIKNTIVGPFQAMMYTIDISNDSYILPCNEAYSAASDAFSFWKNLKSRNRLKFTNHLGNHCLFHA